MPLPALESRPARIIIGCLIGGLVGAVLFAVELFIGAGGHGPKLPLTVTFPFNEILYRANPITPRWLLYLFFLAQFPVYALVFQLASTTKWRWLTATTIIILHALAVWTCFHLPDDFYRRFW